MTSIDDNEVDVSTSQGPPPPPPPPPQPGASQEASGDADTYEQTHVHAVYESIAPHFSATRHKPWPFVSAFLAELAPGSVGLDVGCGNGKNMGVNPSVFMLGCDRSANLVSLARGAAQQHETSVAAAAPPPPPPPPGPGATDVLVADGLVLPFRGGCADFAICIAVVHHMSTRGRRVDAVRELLRCVGAAGRVLVYVWALEQSGSRRGWDEGGEQDLLVPWVVKAQQQKQPKKSKTRKKKKKKKDGDGDATAAASGEKKPQEGEMAAAVVVEEKKEDSSNSNPDKTFQRYYHLYKKGELEEDVLAAGGAVIDSGYERDNWWVIAGPSAPAPAA